MSSLPPPASEDDLDEDERKRRPDFEPFGGAGPPPQTKPGPVDDEPSPEALAEARALFEKANAAAAAKAAAAQAQPAPATMPTVAIEGDTLDRCLIYGIYQGGLAGLFKARNLGLKPEHLSVPERHFYALFEAFVAKSRLPTQVEIRAATGFDLVVPTQPYDVETFGEKIVTRVLRSKLRDGLHPIIYEHLVKDPATARDELAKLVRETSWSRGQASSYTDPATAKTVLDGYLKAKEKGGGLLGLSSPWPNVDKYSLGVQDGELTVILAKRKMGKSWILLKWMLHAYKTDLKPGESLLIISMEMPIALCWRRLAAIDLKLPYEAMRAGRLSLQEEERLYKWVEERQQIDPNKPTIHVLGPDSVRDVADIKSKTAELRPRCVAIDGLYILGRKSNMPIWERTIDNISQIKLDLCAELSVGVIATTQFKGSKSKSDMSVDADDAAYAKAIGDWADAMRGLVANSDMSAQNERLFVGMESREFRAKDILIKFDLEQMNFDEIRVVENSDEFNGAGKPDAKGKGKMTTPAPGSMPTIIAGTLAPNEPPPTVMDETAPAPPPAPAPAPQASRPLPLPPPTPPPTPPPPADPDMPRGAADSDAVPF